MIQTLECFETLSNGTMQEEKKDVVTITEV